MVARDARGLPDQGGLGGFGARGFRTCRRRGSFITCSGACRILCQRFFRAGPTVGTTKPASGAANRASTARAQGNARITAGCSSAGVVPVVNTLAVFGVAATTGTAVIMGSLLGMCWVERKLVGRRPRVPAVSAAVLAGASAPDRAGEVPAGPAAAVPDQARATAPSARPASPAGPVPSARPVPTAERVPAAAPARGAAPRHRRAEPARPRIARLGVPAFSGLLVLVALFASTVSAGLGASGPGPVVRTPARPNRHVATARRRRASRPGDAGVTASPGVGSAQVRGSGSRRSRTRARRRS